MDSARAKETLLLYRPADTALADPEFQEALEQTQRDAELSAWYRQHRAFQDAVRAQFRQLPVPEALPARLLAIEKSANRFLLLPRSFWVGAAASLLLVGVVWSVWLGWPHERRFGLYRQRMARVALREYRMNILTNDLGAIREYLRQNNGLSDYVLTRRLERLPGFGAALLTWRGERVSMICFNNGSKDIYFFVINRNAVPDAPSSSTPQLEQVGKLMTASWTLGNKAYVLAAEADEAYLRRFF